MRYPTRATVCVSSQAGCAMGCTFCATGQAGFERHLDPAEIVEQVHARRARLTATRAQRRVHGHGRAARELRRDVGRDRTTPRRRRDLGAPDHREHGGRGPRDPPARARTAARHPRGVAARGDRRAPQRARPAQPALPDRRGARRGRRLRRREGTPHLVRVRLHRRGQRLTGRRRRRSGGSWAASRAPAART